MTRGFTRATRRSVAPAALFALACALLTLLLFRDSWSDPGGRYIGYGGDPILEMWILRWVPFALSHLHNPLFTNYLNFPDGANAAWFAPPLPGLLMAPVTAATGLIVSYNTLVTGSLVASATCMFVALHRLGSGRWGAAAGGLLYGFSPYMIAHSLAHASLTLAVVPPLLLLFAHEVIVRQRLRPALAGGAIGLLGAAQLALFPEGLAILLVPFCVGIVAAAAFNHRRTREKAGHALRAGAWAGGSFLMLAAPVLRTMLFGSQRLTSGTVHGPNVYVLDALNLLVPTSMQALAPGPAVSLSQRFTGNVGEWTGYLGLPLIVVLVVAVVWLRVDPLARVVVTAGLVVLILALGPSLHIAGRDTGLPLPDALLTRLPLMGNVLPSRFTLVVYLSASVLVSLLITRIVERVTLPPRIVALSLVICSLLVLLPRLSFPSAQPVTTSFFTGPDVGRIPEGSVALAAPFTFDGRNDNPQLWQALTDMRFRMPSGYVFVPTQHGPGVQLTSLSLSMALIELGRRTPAMNGSQRQAYQADLRRWRVGTIIVGPMVHSQQMVRFFTDLLGRAPMQDRDVQVWWGVDAREAAGHGVG